MRDQQPKTKIREILGAALALDEPERSQFLESVYAASPDLGEAIADLLEGRGEMEGFLSDGATAESLPPVFRPGQVVAERFRVVRFQGRGGMGEVYEVRDERLGIRAGLKTIRSGGPDGDESTQRFRREIRVAREVSHPNLCKVFDLVEHSRPGGEGAITCLTMEWLEGETLQTLIERLRPLPVDDALPLLRQIAAAIDALHAAGIVHRDLKPGNVMLVPNGEGATRVVITDFGLAKPVASNGEMFETRLDAQAGAPYFMAPEQLSNEKPAAAADIYAFGLLADEMVTGSRAFDAGSVGALYYQKLYEKPAPPSARRAGLPERWNRAILSCLEREPSARPRTAGDMVRAIEPRSEPERLPERASDLFRRARPAWVAAALVIALLAIGVREPKFEASMVVFRLASEAGEPRDAAESKYLSTGLTAELVARLSRMEGLSVRQNYERRDKARLDTVHERFHLDGDLRAHSGKMRLTVRLTDSSKEGKVVWSQSFDGNLDNPLALETEIASRVAEAVESQMFADSSSIERARYASLSKTRPLRNWLWMTAVAATGPSPAAYNSYLRGKTLLEEASKHSLPAAIPFFEQSLERHPAYGLAHAGLCDTYRAMVNRRLGPQDELMAKARRHAAEAVRLTPGAPEAHASAAAMRQMAWDWEGAEESYREAIRLDPKSPVAYRKYGGLLMQSGRFDEGLAAVRTGLEMDPYDYNSHNGYGLGLILARRYYEAVEYLTWTLERRDIDDARFNLASAYAALGKQASGADAARYFELAWSETQVLKRREGENCPESAYLFAMIAALRGDAATAGKWLETLRSLDPDGRRGSERFARVYGALGHKELAEAHLLRASKLRDRGLLYLKVLWVLDSIRDTAGYKQVLAEMRLL